MSDSEKYEAHGRACARLKDAKSGVATAKTILLEYGERLQAADKLVKRFIDNPLDKSVTGMPLTEHLKSTVHGLFVAILVARI
jgi:hypothetical protein